MKAILYMHGGSNNHGCEALVRSTIKINKPIKFDLLSSNSHEDINIGLYTILENIIQENTIKKFSVIHIYLKFKSIVTNYTSSINGYIYQYLFKKNNRANFYISIGGDNYCYDGFLKKLMCINKRINGKGSIVVLWGCSIEAMSS